MQIRSANRVKAGFSPALPTTPACGSAQGVSSRSPGLSRVMNLRTVLLKAPARYSPILVHCTHKTHGYLFPT